MKILILALGLVPLWGCAHEARREPEAVKEAPARAEAKPDSRPVIVAFGDSLSAGFGVDPGLSYPDFLQKELDRRGYAWRVVNAGISGDTTSGALERVEGVLALRPSIVILEVGANDGLRGIPVSATRANLEEIIVRLRRAGARVVLAGMTLPPNYGPEYTRSFENVFRELAGKHHLSLIPFLLMDVAGIPEYMQSDGR